MIKKPLRRFLITELLCRLWHLSILSLLLLFCTNLFAFTNYVWTGSGTPAAPYDSWSTASHNIQDAVYNAVEGNVVLVTNGVYTLPDDIMIATNNIVLKSINGAAETIIDGNFVDNCIYLRGNSVIDGFFIRNGVTAGSGGGIFVQGYGTVLNCIFTNNSSANTTYGGGAIYANSSLISNCYFKGNDAVLGGGVYLKYNNVVKNCIFEENYAVNGGAIFCIKDSAISDCIIRNNSAGYGGGGFISEGSAIFERSLIIENKADNDGGGFFVFDALADAILTLKNVNVISNLSKRAIESGSIGGGGIGSFTGSEINLINCLFDSNVSSNFGGAIGVNATRLTITSDFTTFPSLTSPPNRFINNMAPNERQGGAILISGGSIVSVKDAIFTNNFAGGFGGAVYIYDSSTCDFVNVIVAKNSSTDSGDGIRIAQDSFLRMLHCTVVDNEEEGVTTTSSSISMTNCIVYGHSLTEVSSGENVQYCNIEGGYSNGVGNIDTNPDFLFNSYELSENSSCISTGINISVEYDCINSARPASPTQPDLGAYEFVPEPTIFWIFNFGFWILIRKIKN